MLVLFDLIDITAGTVLLDGLDVRRVALDNLRRQVSIIPQDPLLFSGAPSPPDSFSYVRQPRS